MTAYMDIFISWGLLRLQRMKSEKNFHELPGFRRTGGGFREVGSLPFQIALWATASRLEQRYYSFIRIFGSAHKRCMAVIIWLVGVDPLPSE